MRSLIIVGLAACLLSTPVAAQRAKSPGDVMKSAPASSTTVTNYHKQSVYDPSDNKIGEIDDVLIGQDHEWNVSAPPMLQPAGSLNSRVSRWRVNVETGLSQAIRNPTSAAAQRASSRSVERVCNNAFGSSRLPKRS
jgi:hypothetical protein